MKIHKTHALLDALIDENSQIRNDADLRRALNIEAATISKIRHGKVEISDSIRVAIMRKFRMSLRRLDDLAPPGAANCGAPAGAKGK